MFYISLNNIYKKYVLHIYSINMENKNKLLNDEKKILAQMMIKQRTKINKNYKLSISNLLKLIKNIDTSISPFDKNKCCIWKGYHVLMKKIILNIQIFI